ncbi:unnamed protein product [Pedinophyceae sp. YPF-701]|nr:unnamed protein product [Pedinophyceae sp. YPF-701]
MSAKRPAEDARVVDDEGAKRPKVEPLVVVEEAEGPPPEDMILSALGKIKRHIVEPKKFRKAAGLLLQLVRADSIAAPEHADALFSALSAAATTAAVRDLPITDVAARRDFKCVFADAAAHECAGAMRPWQRAVLTKAWGPLYEQRHALFTDDSFAFNRALTQVKAAVAELPPATAEDDAALARAVEALASEAWRTGGGGAQPDSGAAECAGGEREPPPPPPPPEDEQEGASGAQVVHQAVGGQWVWSGAEWQWAADGAVSGARARPAWMSEAVAEELRARKAAAKAEAARAAEVAGAADEGGGLTSGQILALRRESLLLCLEAMRPMYKTAWARTGIDLAVAAARQHEQRFCASQRERIDALWKFTQAEKAARRKAGGKADKGDLTSFEQAQRAWGSSDAVSRRGAVTGGSTGGTGGNYNWLG